jgi:hypothetical protein
MGDVRETPGRPESTLSERHMLTEQPLPFLPSQMIQNDSRNPGLIASAQTRFAPIDTMTEIGTAICNLTNLIDSLNCTGEIGSSPTRAVSGS